MCVCGVCWRGLGGNGQTCSKVVTTATAGWVRGLPWRLGHRVRGRVLEGSHCVCVGWGVGGGVETGVQSSCIGCVNNKWRCVRSPSHSLRPSACCDNNV